MTIVGTRPELIKMSRTIAELDSCTRHVLVHTGQNFDYELNQIFFDDLEIRKPDYFLAAAGANTATTIAQVIAKSDEVLETERPDAVLLYGDTNSCLAVLSAKRRKIPVFHMEAGNRCFDQRVPEEINRKVVDHLSDINLVLTEHARRYLLAEGVRPETVIRTGSHMPEVLQYYMPKIEECDILSRAGLEEGKFFLASIHREENTDTPEKIDRLLETLQALALEYGLPIIVSTHPRLRQHIPIHENNLIRFEKPFGFFDYIRLQMAAKCVLSDSGTITEEAALLNLAAVTLREAHERPEGMDEGTLVMCGLKSGRVLESVALVVSQHDRRRPVFRVPRDYETGPVSKQIARIVLSYTDYVARTVWSRRL